MNVLNIDGATLTRRNLMIVRIKMDSLHATIKRDAYNMTKGYYYYRNEKNIMLANTYIIYREFF